MKFRSAVYSFAALTVLLIGCGSASVGPTESAGLAIPAQTLWQDCGIVLRAGAEGEWDAILWGGFATSLVKKGDTYFLYYQGSEAYDDATGTVAWRSIGVATSTDGVHFTKYANNPVLTWFPSNELEEGAVSGGAFVDSDGRIALYYGANTFSGGDQINADGRLAVSEDGFTFEDKGMVLNHADRSVWGAGDEIFPVIGLQDGGRWLTYYIPNGSAERGQLGVAWGSRRDALTNTAAARSNGGAIAVWGPGGYGRLGDGLYALFLTNLRATDGRPIEVRTVSLDDPASLSAPVYRYQFADTALASVMLDEGKATWLMAYGNADHDAYGIRLAPAGDRAVSCSPPTPTPPASTPSATGTPTATARATPAPSPPAAATPRVYLPYIDDETAMRSDSQWFAASKTGAGE